MLKIHKDYNGESYFKGDVMYDHSRVKEYRITLFGITIYRTTENFNIDLISDETITSKRAGFKIGKGQCS